MVCVSFHFVSLKCRVIARENNRPEDTPPNPSNTTFDYSSASTGNFGSPDATPQHFELHDLTVFHGQIHFMSQAFLIRFQQNLYHSK
jgi:hypothetical protein